MAIITSRTRENGIINIDYELCNTCGLCVKVCKDFSLEIEDKKLVVSNSPVFGCIACGQCMAVCPTGAITISGREMSADDRIDLSEMKNKPSYDQLKNLMIGRRSIRDFTDREISDEIIDKILEASVSAPMGLPPSDVHLVVIKGKEKVREFSFDVLDFFDKISYLFAPPMIYLWRLAGKETYKLMKSFARPLVDFLAKARVKNENYLLYDAPLAIYFSASLYSDPADPYIPATYAMLAAETLGIGSCMIGSIHPVIQYGARKLKRKWKLQPKSPTGIVVIFGYPKFKYTSGIKRSFAEVSYIPN
ncbi:MAG: nitroreductase family protein [Prolixibacteraceae bacterium]|nr:nitroreductase family protein [Prolixibacteraceae bacterium]